MGTLIRAWKSSKVTRVVLSVLGIVLVGCCGFTGLMSIAPSDEPSPTATLVIEIEPTPVAQQVDVSTTSTPTAEADATATNTPQPTPTPDRAEAEVLRVVDGDTIEVSVGGEAYTVRYIGVDTPETVHPERPVEWMGPEATAANKALVEGQTIYLEKDVSETDRYGRLLRYVWLADGTLVNEALVRQGYASASSYPPDVKYQDRFREAERAAREVEAGLWGPMPTPTATPVPPTPTPQPPTATPVPPTATTPPEPTLPPPTETQPPAAPGEVRITYILYDGAVRQVESDEYCVIKNVGGSPVNLAGWRLNAGDPHQDFGFPNFELAPGQECRVYTNEYHPESCGFSFGSGRAIWNNDGDCGYLYDNTGTEVSEYCY